MSELKEFIGKSRIIKEIWDTVKRVAPSEANVLIEGETGVGKELIAQAIHKRSRRAVYPFIAVSCASIPFDLLESELFGYVKGAFTGAIKDKPGKLEIANKGTLFLDEIGDMSPDLQAKLLRVIQEKKFERLGSNQTIEVDIRIISATNKNLRKLTQNGLFREDLYYRLNVVKIELPPLRKRIEDIPLLIEHFIKKFSKKNNKKINSIEEEALKILMRYSWPGNIRQLENVIESAIVLSKDEIIKKEDIRLEEENIIKKKYTIKSYISLKKILNAIIKTGGNITKAAKELGIHRTTLHRILKTLEKLYDARFKK
jgi:transcriptional regulator with PAS, ATPase and Fis domain